MEKVSVPKLIDELCEELQNKRRLSLSASTIAFLIRRRVLYSLQWRRKRCLIRSLLLMYYLGRINQITTIHIGCSIDEHYKLDGHSWITAPNLKLEKKSLSLPRDDEIYSKTIYPSKYIDDSDIS